MKTERRHELQTNTLADALGHGFETIRPYSQLVLGLLLAGLLAFVAYQYWSSRSQADQEQAWNAYLHARAQQEPEPLLQSVVAEYPGTPAAQWALLTLGDQNLAEGVEQLFINPAEARDQLRKAEEAYQTVQEQAHDPFLQQRATLGLGRAYESLIELDKARAEYERLAKNWPDSVYAKAAQERLNDLSQKPIREFYDWLADYEPPTTAPPSGLGDPFDIDTLPDQFPGFGSPGPAPGSTPEEAGAEPVAPGKPQPEESAPSQPSTSSDEPRSPSQPAPSEEPSQPEAAEGDPPGALPSEASPPNQPTEAAPEAPPSPKL